MFATLSRKLALVILIMITSLPIVTYAQDDATTTHVIQPGENLFRIALQYGLTTEELAAANNITDATRIFAGQALVVPTNELVVVEQPVQEAVIVAQESPVVAQPEAVVADATPPEIIEQQTRPVYHTVQRGDNLRAIASAYSTSEADIMALNSIANPNRILAGQQLLIRNEPIPLEEVVVVEESPVEAAEAIVTEASSAEETVEVVTHTVQAGEYVSAIARRYSISNDMLLAANNIANPDQLFAGQTLIIPTGLSQPQMNALLYPEPSAVNGTGREIVVDLSNSRVYAYDDGILMYEAVSSNGLPATPTVQGTFTVQSKVRSQTMSGPGYWLPNVEWVMYFYQGYALHGAYWHENWGQPMSHGCVNLRNTDAKWFYEFASIGTPVTVQY